MLRWFGLGHTKTTARLRVEERATVVVRTKEVEPVTAEKKGSEPEATNVHRAKDGVGGGYGDNTTGGGSIPVMRSGNGSLMRHKLQTMNLDDVDVRTATPDQLLQTSDALIADVKKHGAGGLDAESAAVLALLDALPDFGADKFSLAARVLDHSRRSLGIEPLPEGREDPFYDAAFVLPDGRAYEGADVTGATLYVGGMTCDLEATKNAIKALAESSGEHVIGLHNSTSGESADKLEIVKDLTRTGASQPAIKLAETVLEQLTLTDATVKLVGHSQGALITGRALMLVRDRLLETLGSLAEVERVLSRVHVTTLAGTAFDYPDGPQYTHLRNVVDSSPATSEISSGTNKPGLLKQLGDLTHGQLPVAPKLGRGAVLREFNDDDDHTPHGRHRLVTYLRHTPA